MPSLAIVRSPRRLPSHRRVRFASSGKTGTRASTRAMASALDLSSPEVVAALERGERWQLFDVRAPEEWANGHIPGAQLLTPELKFEALGTWPKDTPIVFYSNAGRRSFDVAS